MTNETIFMNRELSWLKFNERVLEEAENEKNPLCERLTFASIYQSNLDEFFMVRVGSLIDQMIVSKNVKDNKTGMTAKEQIQAILARVAKLNRRKDTVYENLMDEVAQAGIRLVDLRKIGKKEGKYLEQYFDAEIAPLISPIVVGKRQPFPFLKNKGIYAVVVLEKKNGKEKLGIIPCNSGVFPRLVQVPGEEETYMLAEELILHFISKVFKGYFVKAKSLIRVTRNADISEDDDSFLDCDFDFRNLMEQLIKKRKKLAPVRLQVFGGSPDSESVKYLCKRLEISDNQIFTASAPLDLSFTFALRSMFEKKKSLCYKPFTPQKSPAVSENLPMADQIRKKDILLHYPYESIKPFIRMLNEAAADPDVVSVKITLYRLARNSKIIQALVDMAERGIDVLVLVELRARFDEENNIGWSKTLQNAGCTIIYGPKGLKVHSKLLLITRKKGDRVEYITQIGTGNYNEKTSELYTDLSLLTANENIAAEALNVFNALSLGHLVEESNHLLVAPLCLQNKVLEMIDEEIAQARAGRKAFIGIKINSLSDRAIIEKLVEASQAGVKTELVIRGLCCLVSGVKGKTDNIRVTSIVGRFLEHSRIYIFGTKQRRKVYISSADFMTRNTVKRVEVAAPVYDPDIQDRIVNIFETMVSDYVKARVQISDGTYRKKRSHKKNLSAQDMFMETASTAASCQNILSLPENSDTPDFSDFYKEFLMQN